MSFIAAFSSWYLPIKSRRAIYCLIFQQIPTRPKTAKPRDPDSYEFNDDQLERDYRKMYDTLQSLEEQANKKTEDESKEDPSIVKQAMEAALVFSDNT